MTTPPEDQGPRGPLPAQPPPAPWPPPPPAPGYGVGDGAGDSTVDDALAGPAAFGLPGDAVEDPSPAATRPVDGAPTQPVPTQPVPTQGGDGPAVPTWAAPPTTRIPVPGPASPPPGTPYPPYGAGVPPGGPGGGGPVRPARPRSAALLVSAVVVLLVLAVAGVAVAALRRSDPTPTTALPTATTSPSSSPSPSTIPPSSPTGGGTDPSASASSPAPSASAPRTTPTPPAVSATRPGWTAVAGRELVAYDVPPAWTALPSGTLTGFETSGGPKQLVIMHNAAAYQDDACPKASSSSRGQAGFVAWKGQPASTVAREVSRQWATVAGTQDDGSVMPLSATTTASTTVAGGTIPATVATTTVTLQDQPSCAAPRIDFTAVSFQVKGQQVIFVLYLDRGVADEVSTADRDAIIASLRPV